MKQLNVVRMVRMSTINASDRFRAHREEISWANKEGYELTTVLKEEHVDVVMPVYMYFYRLCADAARPTDYRESQA